LFFQIVFWDIFGTSAINKGRYSLLKIKTAIRLDFACR
jgi:hypothetical protein